MAWPPVLRRVSPLFQMRHKALSLPQIRRGQSYPIPPPAIVMRIAPLHGPRAQALWKAAKEMVCASWQLPHLQHVTAQPHTIEHRKRRINGRKAPGLTP